MSRRSKRTESKTCREKPRAKRKGRKQSERVNERAKGNERWRERKIERENDAMVNEELGSWEARKYAREECSDEKTEGQRARARRIYSDQILTNESFPPETMNRS